MEHILTKCTSPARTTAWSLANDLWKRRYDTPLPDRLGDILGCGLAKFSKDNKPDKGKNRLFRILVSETAYLIWKLRNERRIRDNDNVTTPITEITTRWSNAINKQLTIDRALTDNVRFGRKALPGKLIRSTWRKCLRNEESLPANWPKYRGVLVGISPPCSLGHGDRIHSRFSDESHTRAA